MGNRKNVYWFLIDGLSPEYLYSCGNKNVEYNFIDSIIEKGTVFNNVICTAGGTHCSMHSIFSSTLPSINGASGWDIEALRRFNPKIVTLTDYFSKAGYICMRYCDAALERTVPMSGFHIWESSGYSIKNVSERTCLMRTPREDDFIDRANSIEQPKFIYHHLLLLHELDGLMGEYWRSDKYIENINTISLEFKKLYEKYAIKKDDVVIISSDHGVLLDTNWLKSGIENGERQYEVQARTFFAIISNDIPKQCINVMVSSLCEAPTITELVLNEKMVGQGDSLKELIQSHNYNAKPVYREKGSYCVEEKDRNPFYSDVFYVRDDKWKYVYGLKDNRCEWLMDIENDGDYKNNLKDLFPEVCQSYRKMLVEEMIDPIESIDSIYQDSFAADYKKNICPFFSIIIQKKINDDIRKSLLDIAGPYYEIIYGKNISYDNLTIKEHICNDLDTEIIRGEYIVYLNPVKDISEYLLSDIYIQIRDGHTDYFSFHDGYVIRKELICERDNISSIQQADNIRTYIDWNEKNREYDKHEVEKALIKILNNIQLGKDFAIYGGGRHKQLLDRIALKNEEYYLIDKNKILNGKHIFPYEIKNANINTVLITSFYHRGEMLTELLKNGYEGQVIDLYCELERRGFYFQSAIFDCIDME